MHIRRCWTCGEADWLRHVAGVNDLLPTLGYPYRFGVRDVVALTNAGVSRDAAIAAADVATVEELIASHNSKPA